MPYLRSLDAEYDINAVQVPENKEWLDYVPLLRSLRICQADSDQSNTEESIIPIRETLAILTELESLSAEKLHLSIQDMIDIACHPKLTMINLTSEDVNYSDCHWFGYTIEFYSEFEQENKKRKFHPTKTSEPEFPHDQQFGIAGDKEREYYDNDDCPKATPERMAADIAHIELSLSLPSSSASQHARLQLINCLMPTLFKPLSAEFMRPLIYLRHLRRQIFMLHTALSKSLSDNNKIIKNSNLTEV